MGVLFNKIDSFSGKNQEIEIPSVDRKNTEAISNNFDFTQDNYNKVIEKLKKGYSEQLAPIIKSIFNSTNNNLKQEVLPILQKILNSKDSVEISSLSLGVQRIFNKYENEKKKVVKESKSKKEGVSEDAQKENLKELKEKIKGSVDDFINGLRTQLDTQGNGQVSLDLGNNMIYFSSKQKALKYIEKLELDLNDESTLWKIFITGLDIISQPFQWPKEFSQEYVAPNFSKDTNEWEWLGDATILALLSAMALNYGETLYRRYAIDILAKMGIKEHPIFFEKIKDENGNYIEEKYTVKNKKGDIIEKTRFKTRKKRLIIPDYSLKKSYFAGDADLRDEYLQRMSILDQLQNELELKTGKEKELFRQGLEKVKSLLNVNTKSFHIEAYALKKGLWNPRKFYWALRNGIVSFGVDLAQEAQTEFNLKESGLLDKYNTGLDYAFDGGKVEIDENDHIRISGIDEQIKQKQYSENIKKFFYAIESDDSLSSIEKENRKERIENFLKTLDNAPRTEEYIKNRLYNIAKNGILEESDILAKIDKAIEKYTPEENKLGSGKGFSEWLSDLPKEAKQNFMKYFSEIYGKNAPAILTKGHAGLIKLKYFTQTLGIEFNEEELDRLISEIESGKIEFSRLYEGITGKLRFLKDISAKSFLAILRGDNIEFTKMKKYSDKISEGDLKDYLNKGEKYLESVEKFKKIAKGSLLKNLKFIFELDSDNFPDELEIQAKEMFDDLIERVEKGELTEEQGKIELVKIYKGELTKFRTIDIIEEENLEQKNIKEFLELVEKGEWYGTKEGLENEIDNCKKDLNYKVEEKIFDTSNLEDTMKEINERGTELGEKHFINDKYGIEFDENGKIEKEGFLNNIEKLAKVYNSLNDGIDVNSNLGKLIQKVNGSKIESPVAYTGEEFFEKLNQALGTNIDINSQINTKTFEEKLTKVVSEWFERLPDANKEKVKNEIKRLKINEDILPPEIQNYINTKIENTKVFIESLEQEFRNGVDIDRKKDIIKELTDLLKKDGLNQEIIDKVNTLKQEINNSIQKAKTKSESKKQKSSQETLSPEKQKFIDLATNEPEKYSEILKDSTERFELRLILEGKETSSISNNPLDIISEVQSNPKKYSEKLLEDFVKKANIDGIDFEKVKYALEDMNARLELNKKILESGKSELKDFWEKAKKLGKDFFKEVKKGKV